MLHEFVPAAPQFVAFGQSTNSNDEAILKNLNACACRKSNPNILVVQPTQDRATKNGPGQFDGARDRRILLAALPRLVLPPPESLTLTRP
jgi:hypothetical protein